MLSNNINFWYDIFQMYKGKRLSYSNVDEADMWISKGEEAMKRNDLVGLSNAVIQLAEMMGNHNVDLVSEQFLPPDIMNF